METPIPTSEKDRKLAIEDEHEQEQRAVIDRILNSPFFARAPIHANLLEYLFKHRAAPVTEQDIARDVYGEEDYSTSRIRKQCAKVREALDKYAAADIVSPNQWRGHLPVGNYQLRMTSLLGEAGPVHAFWYGYLKSTRPVVIVCNEPDFYRDNAADTVVRISHLDIPGGNKTSDNSQASDAVTAHFTGTPYPCHLYAFSGEISARDKIAEWFANDMGVKTEMKFSHDMSFSAIESCSPILLGNRRTNHLISRVTEQHQYTRFAYHVDAEPFGTVKVKGFHEREQKALKKYEPEESGDSLLLHDSVERDKVVFAVVTRLPNRFDQDEPITILSAGYAKVLEEIALTLTREARMTKEMKRIGWPADRRFPRYFQALFSVRLGTEDIDAKPANPKIRCMRHFEKFGEEPTVLTYTF